MSVADFKIPSVQRSSISPAEVLLASRSINSQKSCPPNWNFRRVKNPFSNFVSEPIVRCLSSPLVHWFPKLIFHSFRLLRLRSQWLLQRDSSLLPKRTSKYVLRWIEIFRKHSSRPNARFAKGLSHVKKREASRTRPDPAGERRGEERVFIRLVGVPPGCVFFWHGKGRRYCSHLQKEKGRTAPGDISKG